MNYCRLAFVQILLVVSSWSSLRRGEGNELVFLETQFGIGLLIQVNLLRLGGTLNLLQILVGSTLLRRMNLLYMVVRIAVVLEGGRLHWRTSQQFLTVERLGTRVEGMSDGASRLELRDLILKSSLRKLLGIAEVRLGRFELLLEH